MKKSHIKEFLRRDEIKNVKFLEKELGKREAEKTVVVTHYPREVMAFYKPADKEVSDEALCFDMLAPGGYGEIVGGSERSLDVEDMEKRLRADGEDPADYKFYMDTRKYGSVPHSGYGVGVERVISWICGLENIKDAIPFPRTMLRYKP